MAASGLESPISAQAAGHGAKQETHSADFASAGESVAREFASGSEVAILAGDFEALVHLYRRKVFRLALASLRDVDAAETVTQDCFLRAYQSRDRFRQECSIQTWVMQIAVNLVRDHIRNRRFQFWRRARLTAKPTEIVAHAIADHARSPEDQALIKERVAAIWRAAERLPHKQRIVFLLRFVEDMELLEIAAATGMKEGTVKAHLFRAVRAVRERVGEMP